MIYGLVPLAVLAAVVLVPLWLTRPGNLARYDGGDGQFMPTDPESQQAYGAIASGFAQMGKAMEDMPEAERLKAQREGMEALSAAKDYDARFVPVDQAGVQGEWVLPPHARVRRKILFIHGGFFTMGSPQTHRGWTARLARDCDAAVFAVKYSLQPEHKRKVMIGDCQRAYRWLAGAAVPDGPADLPIAIMGDSAGGNLSLVTARWATRQPGLPAPYAVVAISVSTDASMSSVTRSNADRDVLVGPALAPILKMPPAAWRLAALAKYGVQVNDPEISPLYGDLAGMPPVLLMVSDAEMMLGDNRRYAAKARAARVSVELQVWEGMPHVWLGFDVPCAATEAGWAEITRFLTA